jgi:hypothetical protein
VYVGRRDLLGGGPVKGRRDLLGGGPVKGRRDLLGGGPVKGRRDLLGGGPVNSVPCKQCSGEDLRDSTRKVNLQARDVGVYASSTQMTRRTKQLIAPKQSVGLVSSRGVSRQLAFLSPQRA